MAVKTTAQVTITDLHDIQLLDKAPTNPVVGQQYISTVDYLLRVWTGTEWRITNDYTEELKGISLLDRDYQTGVSLYSDKADNANVHVDIDGESYQKTSVQGKNLLDINRNTPSHSPLPFTQFNSTTNSFEFKKNLSSGFDGYEFTINATEGNRYTVSGSMKGRIYFGYRNSSGTEVVLSEIVTKTSLTSFTLLSNAVPVGVKEIYIKTDGANSSFAIGDTLIFNNMQIELGTVATSFEPFVPNSPSPDYPSEIKSVGTYNPDTSKYAFDLVASKGNRNLLKKTQTRGSTNSTLGNNYDITFNLDGANNKDSYFYLTGHSNFVQDREYTLSFNVTGLPANAVWAFSINNQSKYVVSLKNGFNQLTFICPVNSDKILFDDSARINLSGNITFSNLKIEEGTIATPWCPAPEDIEYNTPYDSINKILISLDEPLRSVGDVKDRIFRDSDGVWKIERNVSALVFNGTELWTKRTDATLVNVDWFQLNLTGNAIDGVGMSSHFNIITSGYEDFVHFRVRAWENGLLLGAFVPKGMFTDVTAFKAWLAQQYNENTPLELQYKIQTSVITTLPDEMQVSLNNLLTYEGGTYIYTVGTEIQPIIYGTFKSEAWYRNYRLNTDLYNTQNEVFDVKSSLDDLSNTIIPALEDNVLTEAEKQAVKATLKQFESEKADLDAQYNVVYNNSNLTGTPKTNLSSAKNTYNNNFSALQSAVNDILNASGTISSSLRNAYETAYTNYKSSLSTLSTRLHEAIKAIEDKIKSDAESYADSAIDDFADTVYTKDEVDAQLTVTSNSILSTVAGTYVTKDYAGNTYATQTALSSVEQTVDGIQGTVTDIQTDLTNLDTRISTAEQQITADAIVSKVVSHTTYKNDKRIDEMQNFKVFKNLTSINSNASSVIGYLVIKTPITNYSMTQIYISGYNYVSNQSEIDLAISFYAYDSTQFLSHGFTSKGTYKITDVKCARDSNGRAVIIIGKSDTEWQYPKIVVDKAIIGHTMPPDSYINGWSALFTTDISSYTNVTELSGMDIQSRITSAEQKITPEAIISTVRSHIEYQNDLAEKASVESVSQIQQTVNGITSTVTQISEDLIKTNPFIIGTGTTAGKWQGNAPFASLVDGQTITFWINIAGAASPTYTSLELLLSNGTSTGEIPCYYNGTTRLTTHFGVNNVIQLTYRENVSGIAQGWWASAQYFSDTYDRLRYNRAIIAKSSISASRLIVGDDVGYFHLLPSVTFDITKPILWAASAISQGATGTNNYLTYHQLTLRNNVSGITLTSGKTVYIKGALNGNMFITNSTTLFTDTPTDDGSVYIALGHLYNEYSITLYPEHPMYKFDSGVFKSFEQIAAEAKAETIVLGTAISQVEQTANKISWLVASGTNASNFTITDRVATLTAEKINLNGLVSFSGLDSSFRAAFNTVQSNASSAKSLSEALDSTIGSWCYNNNRTYINGGKIYTGTVTADKIAANAITADHIAADAITADKIATDAIKSRNYAESGGVVTAGSFLNLADGSYKSKNTTWDADGKITTKDITIEGGNITLQSDISQSAITVTTPGYGYISKITGSGIVLALGEGMNVIDMNIALSHGVINVNAYLGGVLDKSTSIAPYGVFIDGILDVKGDSTLGEINSYTITPRATTTYNLGSSSYRWNYLYARYLNISSTCTFSGSVNISGSTTLSSNLTARNIYFAADNTYEVGSSSVRPSWVRCVKLAVRDYINGTTAITGNFRPYQGYSPTLGTIDYVWDTIYCNKIGTTLVPNTISAWDLGNSDFRFRTIYAVNPLNTSDIRIKSDIREVKGNVESQKQNMQKLLSTELQITDADIIDFIEKLNVYTYVLKKPKVTYKEVEKAVGDNEVDIDKVPEVEFLDQTVSDALADNRMEDIQLGLLANELENHVLYPYIGYKDTINNEKHLALKYNGLTVAALKAIQILLKRINSLENKIQ